jgi:phage minor structural protein
MLPILYPSTTSTSGFFENNGLGFFNHCTKCNVTEERNGIYELEMSILPSDRLAKTSVCGMFVKAKPNPFDPLQIFEIYSQSASRDKIDIQAQHIHYFLNKNVTTEPPAKFTGTPSEVWNAAQIYFALDNPFTFTSNITSSNTILPGNERNISASEFLSGLDGSVLDVFGGEYYYDNFSVSLLQRRGTDTGIALRYGSNISSKQQDSSNQTVYSHIMPYALVKTKYLSTNAEGQMYVNLNNAIEMAYSSLTYKKALLYDFTDRMTDVTLNVISPGQYENLSDVKTRLRQETMNYINKNRAALTQISTNIQVDLTETLSGLQGCKLCDTVLIDLDDNGTKSRAKIIKTVYDVLGERYTKIELGQPKKTIADMITVKNLGGA